MNKHTRTNGHTRHHHYNISRDYKKIKSAIADTRDDVKGAMRQMMYESIENARDKSNELQNTFNRYMAQKPFKALGIAVLAGYLLGHIIRR